MSKKPRIDERISLEDLAALVSRGERPHGEERFREFERRRRESTGA